MSKYTELMLDVACGDASEYDAYIEQAIGKINVSNAIFALESKIAELPEDGDFMCIQEAADAGLPANKADATGASCEAVRQQVVAFYDLVLNTAKKVKEACDKDMKLLIAFGKKNGVPYLFPENDDYSPIPFNTEGCRILGKVVGLHRYDID